MGSEHHTFHVHGHRWLEAGGVVARHAHDRPGGVVPLPLARARPRRLAVPLSRRAAHGGRDDRHLPGGAMRRAALLVRARARDSRAHRAAAQHAADHGAGDGRSPVSIGFDRVTPARLDVVTGDTVTWTNDSVRVHTVTADDEQLRLRPDRVRRTRFTHRFDATGDVPYHCTLHPAIQGVVGVHDLLLDAACRRRVAAAAHSSCAAARAARSPPGRRCRWRPTAAPGFAPVADGDARPATGRSPRASSRPPRRPTAPWPARPRARRSSCSCSTAASRCDARRAGRAGRLRATVAPASRGGHVVLQLFLHERFGWWPVRRARLDAASSAQFTVRTKRRLRRASC